MFKKIRQIVTNTYKFRIKTIDGHIYIVYAKNFNNALYQHHTKFTHAPVIIEPAENIKGTNAILGANGFVYTVHFSKEVTALGEIEAIEAFKQSASTNNLIVQQQYPVWRQI